MSESLSQLGSCVRRYCELAAVNDELATLETAEAVLRARVHVVECLVQDVWVPPPELLAEQQHDQMLLTQRAGALRG